MDLISKKKDRLASFNMNNPVHKTAKKCKFSQEEDKKLVQVVQKLGPKRWKVIASFIDGKTARQCRDRYTNYLRPDLNFDRWTAEEDLLLIQKYYELGPKWSIISNYFHGRSISSLKNRWHSNLATKLKFKKIPPQRKRTPTIDKKRKQNVIEQPKEENTSSLIDWDDDIIFCFDNEGGSEAKEL